MQQLSAPSPEASPQGDRNGRSTHGAAVVGNSPRLETPSVPRSRDRGTAAAREFPPPPPLTSNWGEAMQFYMGRPDFNLDHLRDAKTGPPYSIPKTITQQFTECGTAVLQYISIASQQASPQLSPHELWRLRALFSALPKLLLRCPERLTHAAKQRVMSKRCLQFMTGQWEVLWKTFSRDLSQGPTVPKGRYRQDAVNDLLDVEDLARAGNLGKAMQRLLKVGAEPVAGTQPLTQEQAWEALQALHPQVQIPTHPKAVHEPVSDGLSETILKALGFEEEGDRQKMIYLHVLAQN